MKKAVLLINLGTPDAAHEKSVYRYLKEFLNDPRVLDLSLPIRWVLSHLIVIPFRYKKSTKAYQKIWAAEGSPLLLNSKKLAADLSQYLGNTYHVKIAMRYGNPNIPSVLAECKNYDELIILPLFPQYASASTGSALERVLKILATQSNIPTLKIHHNFYNDAGFITASSQIIKQHIEGKKIEHFVLSYHGLPERHIDKSECVAACNRVAACPEMSEENAYCYRAQCYATSRLLANRLHLTQDQYSVAFQSRLGRTPWIKPYLDFLLPELRQKGIQHIAIACPSFVADCLETLEEIDIRAREQWKALGGETFIFIPAVNDHPRWVQALAELIHNN